MGKSRTAKLRDRAIANLAQQVASGQLTAQQAAQQVPFANNNTLSSLQSQANVIRRAQANQQAIQQGQVRLAQTRFAGGSTSAEKQRQQQLRQLQSSFRQGAISIEQFRASQERILQQARPQILEEQRFRNIRASRQAGALLVQGRRDFDLQLRDFELQNRSSQIIENQRQRDKVFDDIISAGFDPARLKQGRGRFIPEDRRPDLSPSAQRQNEFARQQAFIPVAQRGGRLTSGQVNASERLQQQRTQQQQPSLDQSVQTFFAPIDAGFAGSSELTQRQQIPSLIAGGSSEIGPSQRTTGFAGPIGAGFLVDTRQAPTEPAPEPTSQQFFSGFGIGKNFFSDFLDKTFELDRPLSKRSQLNQDIAAGASPLTNLLIESSDFARAARLGRLTAPKPFTTIDNPLGLPATPQSFRTQGVRATPSAQLLTGKVPDPRDRFTREALEAELVLLAGAAVGGRPISSPKPVSVRPFTTTEISLGRGLGRVIGPATGTAKTPPSVRSPFTGGPKTPFSRTFRDEFSGSKPIKTTGRQQSTILLQRQKPVTVKKTKSKTIAKDSVSQDILFGPPRQLGGKKKKGATTTTAITFDEVVLRRPKQSIPQQLSSKQRIAVEILPKQEQRPAVQITPRQTPKQRTVIEVIPRQTPRQTPIQQQPIITPVITPQQSIIISETIIRTPPFARGGFFFPPFLFGGGLSGGTPTKRSRGSRTRFAVANVDPLRPGVISAKGVPDIQISDDPGIFGRVDKQLKKARGNGKKKKKKNGSFLDRTAVKLRL